MAALCRAGKHLTYKGQGLRDGSDPEPRLSPGRRAFVNALANGIKSREQVIGETGRKTGQQRGLAQGKRI